MLTSIVGFNLPGCVFCRPDGSLMNNVHVGFQVGREPAELVKADAFEVRWDFDVEVVTREGQPDFRGRAVHGKRGDRFVYLTWGEPRRRVRDVSSGQAGAEPDRRGRRAVGDL